MVTADLLVAHVIKKQDSSKDLEQDTKRSIRSIRSKRSRNMLVKDLEDLKDVKDLETSY